MINVNMQILMFFIFMSFIMLNFYYKHMLLFVISLEFIMMNIMNIMFNYSIFFNLNINMIMFFLIINVCESALSLSLIILLIRYHGNDYINSITMKLW